MNRIQKVSRLMALILTGLLIALPAVDILKWLFIETEFVKNLPWPNFVPIVPTPEGPIDVKFVQWTPLSRLIAYLSDLLCFAPIFVTLFSLRSIFNNYAGGDIFTSYNARHYRLIGWCFFFNALLIKPLSGMLMVLSVTLLNPPGHRYISLEFGTPNMENLFYGTILIVISWVMLEATKLREEQDYVI